MRKFLIDSKIYSPAFDESADSPIIIIGFFEFIIFDDTLFLPSTISFIVLVLLPIISYG